jgi:hypothetical protein
MLAGGAAAVIWVGAGWRAAPANIPPCSHGGARFGEGNPLQLSIPGPITDVPEYHDCQRFIVMHGNTAKFEAIEAVFVRDSLEKVDGSGPDSLVDPHGPSKYDSAVAKELRLPNSMYIRIRTVGEIYSEGAYPSLNIEPTFDCLVMAWVPSQPKHVAAWMVPVSPESRCKTEDAAALLSSAASAPLNVRVAKASGTPPVAARWEWNPAREVEYIGIYCPAGWCMIYGGRAFAPAPDHGVNPRRVHGWYDEQRLAEPSKTGPVPNVGNATGWVRPDPGLSGRPASAYSTSKWLPSAVIELDGPSSVYLNKLGVSKDKSGKYTSSIDICMADGSGRCEGIVPDTKGTCPVSPGGGLWFARIHAGNGATIYRCVEYEKITPPFQPPGTTRWAWVDDDDTVWISCPSGCCKVKVL